MAPSNKQFPAATEEDQEGIVRREHGTPMKIGTPPFSSPNPETEGLNMVPVTDDVTPEMALPSDTSEWKAKDFTARVKDASSEEQLAEAEKLYKDSGKDYSTVGEAIDKRRQELADEAVAATEADLLEKIESATSTDELDKVIDQYEESEIESEAVEEAVAAKQETLAGDSGDQS